jgi:hypothetical protein
MKAILYTIIIAFSMLSCVDENHTNNDTKTSTNSIKLSIDTSQIAAIDSTIIESNRIEKEQGFINPEFLDLVKTIDSSGYLYDTIKARRSYRYFNSAKIITEKGYLFYETELKNTVPFTQLNIILSQIKHRGSEDMDSLELQELNAFKTERLIDFKLLEKVKSIYSYHYISKRPSTSGSSKFFTDGVIEQWQFESEEAAKIAGNQIGKKELFVYFNRGAYVCYFKNYVYVFHSRAAGFYTPLKNFFTTFVTTNTATKAKRGRLRNYY